MGDLDVAMRLLLRRHGPETMIPAKFAAATFIAGVMLGSAPCAWADRPGTPNQESAQAIGPHAIRVYWTDTAHGRDFVTSPSALFEVEGQAVDWSKCANTPRPMGVDVQGLCKPDPSSGYLYPSAYDVGGAGRLHWDAGDLPSGRSHCFRVWSRNRDDDLRSDQPSAWACAALPAETAPAVGAPMVDRQIAPMRGQVVWLPVNADGVRVPKSDGFVMAITPGHTCPAPWRDVIHQNGGFPGVNPSARRASDPYWLCWSALLPGSARVTTPAPAPAPVIFGRH